MNYKAKIGLTLNLIVVILIVIFFNSYAYDRGYMDGTGLSREEYEMMKWQKQQERLREMRERYGLPEYHSYYGGGRVNYNNKEYIDEPKDVLNPPPKRFVLENGSYIYNDEFDEFLESLGEWGSSYLEDIEQEGGVSYGKEESDSDKKGYNTALPESTCQYLGYCESRKG